MILFNVEQSRRNVWNMFSLEDLTLKTFQLFNEINFIEKFEKF